MPSTLTLSEAAHEFLSLRRIAVIGVSRDSAQPANLIFRRLRETQHEVFAVNASADEVEDVPAYPVVGAIPGGVEGAVIVPPPHQTAVVMQQCIDADVAQVWIHRGIGPGSSSPLAVDLGRAHGVRVIP